MLGRVGGCPEWLPVRVSAARTEVNTSRRGRQHLYGADVAAADRDVAETRNLDSLQHFSPADENERLVLIE